MAKKVIIDEAECIGCESCVEICPDVFEFDEANGKALVKNPEALDECIQEAMDTCPVECIEWEED